MQDKKCPSCGSSLLSRDEGACLVFHCSQCSWEALTTHPGTPFSDETAYEVRIAPLEDPPPRVSASLAVALGISSQTARELLRRGEPVATDIPAVEVQRLHGLLSPLGLSLQIKPRFRWALE
ncbi:MAG TPA: hypothetical protein VLS27_11095 [Gammaproteobacteria bacterium]|nr:hypothetical protein [Gammaproteobacteria bacterium]